MLRTFLHAAVALTTVLLAAYPLHADLIDADDDGFFAVPGGIDHDDNDASFYPGAPEFYDNSDRDGDTEAGNLGKAIDAVLAVAGNYSITQGEDLILDASASINRVAGSSLSSFGWDLDIDGVADFVTTSSQLTLTSQEYSPFLSTPGVSQIHLVAREDSVRGFSSLALNNPFSQFVNPRRQSWGSIYDNRPDLLNSFGSVTVTAVPEPASLAMLSMAGIAACFRRRKIN